MIKRNFERLKAKKGKLTAADHPIIRNEEECYDSSLKAIQFAKNITAVYTSCIFLQKELQLFTNMLPLKDKRITAEVCVHHLHFTSDDYELSGNLIKCNPAIKHHTTVMHYGRVCWITGSM